MQTQCSTPKAPPAIPADASTLCMAPAA
jgi:hypothetical protein